MPEIMNIYNRDEAIKSMLIDKERMTPLNMPLVAYCFYDLSNKENPWRCVSSIDVESCNPPESVKMTGLWSSTEWKKYEVTK